MIIITIINYHYLIFFILLFRPGSPLTLLGYVSAWLDLLPFRISLHYGSEEEAGPRSESSRDQKKSDAELRVDWSRVKGRLTQDWAEKNRNDLHSIPASISSHSGSEVETGPTSESSRDQKQSDASVRADWSRVNGRLTQDWAKKNRNDSLYPVSNNN